VNPSPAPHARRGGNQRIPRPSDFELGRPAPWLALPPEARTVSVNDVLTFARAPRELAVDPEFTTVDGDPSPRLAAVLIAVFTESGDPHDEARVILTRRPETMPSHQGEIAFPGGGHHGDDASLAATALREAHEEIGLEPSAVELVGQLDALGPTRTGFLIHPFVGTVVGRPTLVPHPREVSRVFDVSLTELLADGVHHEERWSYPQLNGAVSFFTLADETVWGATARILTRFLSALVADRLIPREQRT
jgi:8-oxo-dGTP pyrophosphatase MutT (NUDIX family)